MIYIQKTSIEVMRVMDDFIRKYNPTKYGKILQSINRVRLFCKSQQDQISSWHVDGVAIQKF